MKKTILFAAAAVVFASCSDRPKYAIEGDVAGLEGTVYMFQGDSLVDSAKVEKGKFRFKGVCEAPAVRTLRDSRNGQPQAFAMHFICEPGTIRIQSDPEDVRSYRMAGTPANDAGDRHMIASRELIEEFRDTATTDERRKAIRKEYEQLGRRTVDENLDNFFGVVMMSNLAYELSGQELLELIAKFSPEMQRTGELAELKKSAEQKIRTQEGQPYIDIVQKNAEGEEVSLRSVIENPANKYTLVDFWASWCGPCMGEVPYLTRTYDQYHRKGFEIYGVSFDNDRDKWLAAVEDHGMGWIHVSDVNGFDNQAAKDYAIQAIPSNFLIDARGRIVAKNLRGEALEARIAELLD